MMKKLLIVVLLVVFSQSAFAATFKDTDDARTFFDKVMEVVGKGDIEGGLKQLTPYSVVPEAEMTVLIQQIGMQLPMIQSRFGKSIGHEFLKIEKVGESVAKFTYLQKFEKHVMAWKFIIYKPNDKWLLNTFDFNDKIKLLFR
jgi:hypothetical protein